MDPSPRRPRWRVEGARASAGFAVRTTIAAQLALLSASALGLHNTHWAAMTVWLVAQPTRGLLLEKSFLRIAGTLVGAAAGFGLLALFPDRPVPLVVGLALWGALCAGASAFVRPARAYGILLAGYTAIMLVLPSSSGAGTIHGLFADRVLCTLVGVLVSTAVTGLLTPACSPASLDGQLRRLGDDVFAVAHALRSGAITRPLLDGGAPSRTGSSGRPRRRTRTTGWRDPPRGRSISSRWRARLRASCRCDRWTPTSQALPVRSRSRSTGFKTARGASDHALELEHAAQALERASPATADCAGAAAAAESLRDAARILRREESRLVEPGLRQRPG